MGDLEKLRWSLEKPLANLTKIDLVSKGLHSDALCSKWTSHILTQGHLTSLVREVIRRMPDRCNTQWQFLQKDPPGIKEGGGEEQEKPAAPVPRERL